MIPTIPFAIGFLVYILFCTVTSHVISRRRGKMNSLYVLFIYIYYSILAVYLLWIVEEEAPMMVFLIEAGVYLLGAGMVQLIYYHQQIAPEHRYAFQ